MEYAKIENGIVTNVILADAEYVNDPMFIESHPGVWVEMNTGGVGWSFDGSNFTAPKEPVVPPVVNPTEWLIDRGPFYDRFGTSKTEILTSTDVGIRAILDDVAVRQWIDLQRPEVAQSLAYIGSKIASVTPEKQTTILTTPVTQAENLVLRKLYF